MSALSLTSNTVVAPQGSDPLKITFTTSPPLDLSTSIQLCLKASEDIEVYLERMTAQSIARDEGTGEYLVAVPQSQFPRFKASSAGSSVDVDIVLHQWKGERHLGSWTMGSMQLSGY